MNQTVLFPKNREFAVLGFGEVMMRLSPAGNERIVQGNSFIKNPGGSELNVVSGVARLGPRCGLISKLPDTIVGHYISNAIRACRVSDDYVLFDKTKSARLGLYYYESGGYPRKPQVVYDRANSSFTTLTIDEIPTEAFSSSAVFHTSGISLALGNKSRDTTIALVKAFKKSGTTISFDVNYRANLWSEEDARTTITYLLPYIDILFVSEETSRRMFRRTGSLTDIQKQYHDEYGVSVVASTQRTINSPHSHTFTSMLFAASTGAYYTEKPYENIEVTDRIGSGDAYISGVLYALLVRNDFQEAVAFGNAMSSLKNTVPGDMLATDLREIEGILSDHKKTGPISEMSR